MIKIAQVQIKPECRETHGYLEAFNKATEVVESYYKIFATANNKNKTFTVELHIEDSKEANKRQ